MNAEVLSLTVMPQIGVKKKIKQHARGERPNKRRVKLIVC